MIYVVVPTYGKVEETEKLFFSIKACENIKFKFLVVDAHVERPYLKSSIISFENVTVLCPDDEVWWVGAINFAVNHLNGLQLFDDDVIIFANSDVFIDPASIDKLVDYAILKEALFHPLTYSEKGTLLSSGVKILSWLPYITKRPPLDSVDDFFKVDCANTRFLVFKYKILKKVGFVNSDLVQYQGDYDFTYSAKKLGFDTYIAYRASCVVDESETGLKNNNIKSFKELYFSFFKIRSSNNIKYRFLFVSKFFPAVIALFIVLSMTLNSIVRYIITMNFLNIKSKDKML